MNKRALETFAPSLLVLVLVAPPWSSPGDAQAADKQGQPEGKAAPAATVTDIRFSFKLDPRLIDSTYGGERWVSPRTYTGVTAQDTVDARAQVVGAKGAPAKLSPEWIPSDPEMVTVAPSQGTQVRITVHRAGESRLNVTSQGFSKELAVKAKGLGKAIQIEITPLEIEKKPGGDATQEGQLKSQKEQLSYALGMNLAKSLQRLSIDVDADLLVHGFKDTHSGSKTLLTDQELQAALVGVEAQFKNEQAALERKELAEKNKKDGEAFLAENKKKEGVVSLPSGLQYKIVKAGEGKKPTSDDAIVCNYRGTLIDGTQFERGGPLSIPLKSVIKGWKEALQLMPVGSKWQLFIPPDLAYGERAPRRSRIPPNATLIVEVELLSVQEGSGPALQSRLTTHQQGSR